MNLDLPFSQYTFIAFDLETSGAYPLESQICEIAAVKWRGGKIVDRYQTLVKPTHRMSDFIIGIHGITNEMVESAPAVENVITAFHQFISDGVPIAHHAAFDMGFLAIEFEKKNLKFPATQVLCSSLLARKIFLESQNHKLQTLIRDLGITQGVAHRALDDAEACLQVALIGMERLGGLTTLADLYRLQESSMVWENFSMQALEQSDVYWPLVQAIKQGRGLEIQYQGGSRPGEQFRAVVPRGLVRGPDGDYLVAQDPLEEKPKRFYLKKIAAARLRP